MDAHGIDVTASQRLQLQRLCSSIGSDLPFLIAVAAYVLIGAVVFWLFERPQVPAGSYLANGLFYVAAAVMLLGPRYLFRLAVDRPDSPFAHARHLMAEWKMRERVVVALPALAGLTAFMPTFSAFKSSIPAINPYSYDHLFVRLDVLIHGGDAWRVIHPLVGFPAVSFVLNLTYHLWILLLYIGVLVVVCSLGSRVLRLRFLLTYAACWIVLGTGAAIWMSSVGPCFYDDFFGSDRFTPLMAYLASADRVYPIMALDVQQQLLDWQSASSNSIGRGITAMPSMHVSIATLFAIYGWKISRGWGVLATAFLILILLGSVHLGYHYAVDGYVSVIVSLFLWWVVGRIVGGIEHGVPTSVRAWA